VITTTTSTSTLLVLDSLGVVIAVELIGLIILNMLYTLVFFGQSSVQLSTLKHIIQGYQINILTNFTCVFVSTIVFIDLTLVVGIIGTSLFLVMTGFKSMTCFTTRLSHNQGSQKECLTKKILQRTFFEYS